MGNCIKNNFFKHSFRMLTSNKLRFFLTIFGVVCGVAAFSFAVLNFDNKFNIIETKYEQFGEDTIVMDGTFSYEDFYTISSWENVYNIVGYGTPISYSCSNNDDCRKYNLSVFGVGNNFLNMPIPDQRVQTYVYYSELVNGRMFSQDEMLGKTNVAIISESSSAFIFGEKNGVGNVLRTQSNGEFIDYTIVGIIRDSLLSLNEADSF